MENKHTLDTWLTSEGRSGLWFATRVGVNDQAVSRWRNGKATPSLTARILIEHITQGAVTAASWVEA